MQKEMVKHPDHYQSKSGLEVWEVIEAFTSDMDGVEAFDTGNIIKYACRWKNKNGIEDLKKIVEYSNHLIKHLEEKNKVQDIDVEKISDEGIVVIFNNTNVIDTLQNLGLLFGYITVADILQAAGIMPKRTDMLYGWIFSDIQTLELTKLDDGKYKVCLPKPEEIK